MSKDKKTQNGTDPNLAEDVLRQGGKSEDEVKRTGAIDRAEDEFEKTLDPKARTVNSPVHKAVWKNGKLELTTFRASKKENKLRATYKVAMDRCKAVVSGHVAAGTVFNEKNKVSDQVLLELAEAGYFGMLVSPEFQGSGACIADFMEFITDMAAEGDATIAGLNSIHECIGAVDPLEGSGTPEQQNQFLPILATGKKLSAFALTEPGAGSDLTAVKTTAVLNGDYYEVTGEKLFISNVVPGRIIGLVVVIDGKHNVLIAELPDQEDETFQLVPYGIHAVQHIYNQGIKFNKFRVPAANLLKVFNPKTNEREMGKGLIIAYHGLNRGRVALCANAAGVMRTQLKSLLPWVAFRKTYGQPIEKRELVKRRVARIASLIVGADALRDWCSGLLDEGYRGELECIIAKIFGADALAEATIKSLKTHGGRSFLKGHLIGDNLHDFFAPSIYEGENEMLAMAFFKGLSKEVGMKYMGPLMGVMSEAGVNMKKLQKPSLSALGEAVKLLKPKALFGLVRYGLPIGFWVAGNELRGNFSTLLALVLGLAVGTQVFFAAAFVSTLLAVVGGLASFAVATPIFGKLLRAVVNKLTPVNGVSPKLQKHAQFARAHFARLGRTLYRNMLAQGVGLADQQDLMVDELSMPIQKTVTMLVTCYHATEKGDNATIAAADLLCLDLTRELTGGKVSKDAGYRRKARRLADMVGKGEFTQLNSTPATEILRQYKQD
ncbi:MAG TPA: acyl-CoA dehydrogenase family protein [Planktothrix sp.]|jgi:alkylation response protein AidB-like acyl-CoA dehydrogenase